MNHTSNDHTPEAGWGTPSTAGPTAAPVDAGWTLLRRILLWAVLVLGVAGAGFGLWMAAEDAAQSGDMFHGLGIALGLALAVPSLLICVLAGLGLRSMQDRGAAGGRPQTIAAGALLLLLLPLAGVSSVMLLPVALGIALLGVVFVERRQDP